MSSPTATLPPISSHKKSPEKLPWPSWLLLIATGCVALGPLTVTWNDNPNYSFGWMIPVVCLVLFAERWPTRSPHRPKPLPFILPAFVLWGLLFFAFRLAAETDPDWRPGLWILVVLYAISLLAWLWLEGGWPWVRHFCFPVGFLFLGLPWFFEIEHPLTQGLMHWNAILVSRTLQTLGIFAQPVGNIIHLQDCRLGVEEACSGILSLQASVVMGFLLGDIYRLIPRHRLLLIVISMGLALTGNYLRTLFLALMAIYKGPDAVPQWHDAAGYFILAFTALGSWLAALCLFHPETKPPQSTPLRQETPGPASHRSLHFAAAIFGVALLAEATTQTWYSWKESSLVRHPAWAVQFPAVPSFKKVDLSDTTRQALRCDYSDVGQWQDVKGWDWFAYWIRYDPKPYTRIVLGWHNPDNCMPSIGLVKDQDFPDFKTTVSGLDFNIRPRKFISEETHLPVYVFWIVYPLKGGLPSDAYSVRTGSYLSKFWFHLRDIQEGYRGVGVETLEIVLSGPRDYESAKAGLLKEFPNLITPASSAGTSH